MNNFITQRCKEIIICLVITILFLIIFLFYVCSNKQSTDNSDLAKNLPNFIAQLRSGNTIGVALIPLDPRKDKLSVYGYNLNPIYPCKNEKDRTLSLDEAFLPIDTECTNNLFSGDIQNQQLFSLIPTVPSKKNTESNKKQPVIIRSFDYTETCVPPPDGGRCR